MERYTYMNRKNRDDQAKKLKNKGKVVYKSSTHNQNLHPMYVFDYESETGNVLTQEDKGFGNTIYKTFFPTLYKLEVK